MRLIWPVTNRPLSPLFYGEKSKGTVTLSRRGFSFPLLWTDSAWRLTGTVTDEENLFQARHRLLRPPNNDSISDGGAVFEHVSMDSFKTCETTSFQWSRHHRTHRRPRHERCTIQELWRQAIISLSGFFRAVNFHVIILMSVLRSSISI